MLMNRSAESTLAAPSAPKSSGAAETFPFINITSGPKLEDRRAKRLIRSHVMRQMYRAEKEKERNPIESSTRAARTEPPRHMGRFRVSLPTTDTQTNAAAEARFREDPSLEAPSSQLNSSDIGTSPSSAADPSTESQSPTTWSGEWIEDFNILEYHNWNPAGISRSPDQYHLPYRGILGPSYSGETEESEDGEESTEISRYSHSTASEIGDRNPVSFYSVSLDVNDRMGQLVYRCKRGPSWFPLSFSCSPKDDFRWIARFKLRNSIFTLPATARRFMLVADIQALI
jgi:hypothetical protein